MRLGISLVVFAFGLVVAVSALFLVQRTDQASPSQVGGAFLLQDQDNRYVSEKDLIGKPSLVFFGFTFCPDVCPTKLLEVTQILDALGDDASRVQVFFVSVDPARDRPEILKEYLASFHKVIQGLTGSQEAVDSIIKNYKAYAKKVLLDGDFYTMDHSAVVYLMDKQGRFVAPFSMDRAPSEAAAMLRKYF